MIWSACYQMLTQIEFFHNNYTSLDWLIGLGFRPKPSKDDEDSATIQFTNEADGNWKYYSSELKDFLGCK